MGIPAPLGVATVGSPPAGDRANGVVIGAFSAIGPGQPIAFQGPFNVSIWASVNTSLTTTAASGSASVVSGTGIATGTAINSANVPAGTTWLTFSGTSGTLAFPTICLSGVLSGSTITGLPSTAGLTGATVTTVSTAEGITVAASTTVTAILQAAVNGAGGVVQLSSTPTVVVGPAGPQFFNFALTNSSVTGGTDTNAVFTGAGITYSGTIQLERSFDGGATWLVANVGGSGTLAQYTTGTPVALVFGEPEAGVLYRLNCTTYSSGTINYRISTTSGAAQSLRYSQLA